MLIYHLLQRNYTVVLGVVSPPNSSAWNLFNFACLPASLSSQMYIILVATIQNKGSSTDSEIFRFKVVMSSGWMLSWKLDRLLISGTDISVLKVQVNKCSVLSTWPWQYRHKAEGTFPTLACLPLVGSTVWSILNMKDFALETIQRPWKVVTI